MIDRHLIHILYRWVAGAEAPATRFSGEKGSLPSAAVSAVYTEAGSASSVILPTVAAAALFVLNRATSSFSAEAWAPSSSLLDAISSLPAADCSVTSETPWMAFDTSSAFEGPVVHVGEVRRRLDDRLRQLGAIDGSYVEPRHRHRNVRLSANQVSAQHRQGRAHQARRDDQQQEGQHQAQAVHQR